VIAGDGPLGAGFFLRRAVAAALEKMRGIPANSSRWRGARADRWAGAIGAVSFSTLFPAAPRARWIKTKFASQLLV
jgi:hypothetical protein